MPERRQEKEERKLRCGEEGSWGFMRKRVNEARRDFGKSAVAGKQKFQSYILPGCIQPGYVDLVRVTLKV
jgi:hypothetical protein